MTPFRMDVGDLELWAVRHGEGPDVLLIAGLSDPAEAWQFQLDGLADRYCLIAFHNRGAGRTPLPDGPLSVPMMAGDAAALLRALKVQAAQYLVRDLLTERARLHQHVEEQLNQLQTLYDSAPVVRRSGWSYSTVSCDFDVSIRSWPRSMGELSPSI